MPPTQAAGRPRRAWRAAPARSRASLPSQRTLARASPAPRARCASRRAYLKCMRARRDGVSRTTRSISIPSGLTDQGSPPTSLPGPSGQAARPGDAPPPSRREGHRRRPARPRRHPPSPGNSRKTALGDVGALGDLVDRRGVDPLRQELLPRRGQNARPGFGALARPASLACLWAVIVHEVHRVRGTVRGLEDETRNAALSAILPGAELAAADLRDSGGWREAMDGVDWVFHVASPQAVPSETDRTSAASYHAPNSSCWPPLLARHTYIGAPGPRSTDVEASSIDFVHLTSLQVLLRGSALAANGTVSPMSSSVCAGQVFPPSSPSLLLGAPVRPTAKLQRCGAALPAEGRPTLQPISSDEIRTRNPVFGAPQPFDR